MKIYTVIHQVGLEIEELRVFADVEPAAQHFDQIALTRQLSPEFRVEIHAEDLWLELPGTLRFAGDDTESVQLVEQELEGGVPTLPSADLEPSLPGPADPPEATEQQARIVKRSHFPDLEVEFRFRGKICLIHRDRALRMALEMLQTLDELDGIVRPFSEEQVLARLSEPAQKLWLSGVQFLAFPSRSTLDRFLECCRPADILLLLRSYVEAQPTRPALLQPKKCAGCGDRLTGHEDDSGAHCRWCVQGWIPSGESNSQDAQANG